MSAQLSLLDSEYAKGRRELERMGRAEDNAAVFRALRPTLERIYWSREARIRRMGQDERGETVPYVTADDAWPYLEDNPHVLERLSSANALGALFIRLPGWKAIGYTRSERKGSHGNLLRKWALEREASP